VLPIVIAIVAVLCLQNVAATFKAVSPARYHINPMEQRRMPQQQEEAVRVWERPIAAKGGRERLHSVRNVVISSHGEYASRLFKKNRVRREELLVLPNKYWFSDDYRPDVFGLTVSMYNYDRNTTYVITPGEAVSQE